MRTFIAVEISEAQKRAIAGLERDLKRSDAAISWVRPENVHITLKFLGEVPEERLQDVFRITEEVCSASVSFAVDIRDTGVFPAMKRPRVIWVGIGRGKDELKKISELLDIHLARQGFPREERPFKPHVTIGRVKGPRNIQKAIRRLQEIEFEAGSYIADKVVVMKSELKPGGAVYTPQKIVPLGAV